MSDNYKTLAKFDDLTLRQTFGKFATGVCIVAIENDDSSATGMTINSFSSVSLSPPLVLWSLQNDSDRYESFAQAQRYSINILNENQQAISNFFATSGELEPPQEWFTQTESGAAPILQSCMAVLECEQYQVLQAGDHLIILGRVTSIHQSNNSDDTDNENPLLFFNGEYGTIDNPINEQ